MTQFFERGGALFPNGCPGQAPEEVIPCFSDASVMFAIIKSFIILFGSKYLLIDITAS